MKQANPFYRSSKWERKREVILRTYDYMCQESKRFGKTEQASPVHHIYPREEYPELALVDWNLIPLCKKQHNAMHDRKSGEITAKGREWQERVRDKFERWVASRNN